MKRLLVPMLVVLSGTLVPAAPTVKGGTITGTVVVVEKGARVANPSWVYVYLEEETPSRRPGEGMTASIAQSSLTFVPEVVVVPAYATVWFPNKDKTDHSVFSPTEPDKGGDFLLVPYGKSERGKSNKFLQPREYKIYCDIHPEMRAYVKVVPSRFIAQVQGGKYQIPDVPPGRYRAVAWTRESRDVKSEWITITANEAKAVTELHLQAEPIPAEHLRADGSNYDYRNK